MPIEIIQTFACVAVDEKGGRKDKRQRKRKGKKKKRRRRNVSEREREKGAVKERKRGHPVKAVLTHTRK